MKIIFFLAVTGSYMVLILFFSAYRIMPWSGLARETDMVIVLIPVYPLFWGLCISMGIDEIKEVKYALYVPMTIAISMIPLTAGMIGYYTRWYMGVAAFPVLVALLFLPYFVKWLIDRHDMKLLIARRKESINSGREDDPMKQNAAGSFRKLAGRFMDELVIPAGAVLAMLFWQIMNLEMMNRVYANWNLPPDTSFITWSLFLSGIVPLRCLTIMQPPFRPLNLIISMISMVYYLLSVFGIV